MAIRENSVWHYSNVKEMWSGFYTKTAEDATWRSFTIDNKTMFSYAATELQVIIVILVTYKLIFKVN